MRRSSSPCNSTLLYTRIYTSFYNWRINRSGSSKCRIRCCFPWYLLCSSSLPLCSLNGSCLRYVCWSLLLNRKNYRVKIWWTPRKNPFLNILYWSKRNFFPYALFRSIRYATTYIRLSRRICTLEFNCLIWVFHLGYCDPFILLYPKYHGYGTST